jgi:predicted amidophosphoribosyltransferase
MKDGLRGQAWDKAFQEAIEEIRPKFHQCTRCGIWVCPEVCKLRKVDQTASFDASAEMVSMCPGCKSRLQAGAKFCPGCGKPVGSGVAKAFCTGCGAQLQAGARFCAGCGQAAG